MVTFDLAPGNHTIKMTLAGYDLLEATIYVSDTGGVWCRSVVDGTCYREYGPSLIIDGNSIIGYLKQEAVVADVCTWVTNLGGSAKISSFNIMELVSAYSGNTNLGFDVSAAMIMGAVAYYSGNKISGNSLMGCAF